jgi:hypothetical protein
VRRGSFSLVGGGGLAWLCRPFRRAGGCGGWFAGAGIIRRGWSGLRHLGRIVLAAGARGRESRAGYPAGRRRGAEAPGGAGFV